MDISEAITQVRSADAQFERAWEAEGSDRTAYGVMNAFTRVATHEADVPARTRDVLARMGGLLAFRHQHMCPRCWSLVNAERN